jgi:hypothetical protein
MNVLSFFPAALPQVPPPLSKPQQGCLISGGWVTGGFTKGASYNSIFYRFLLTSFFFISLLNYNKVPPPLQSNKSPRLMTNLCSDRKQSESPVRAWFPSQGNASNFLALKMVSNGMHHTQWPRRWNLRLNDFHDHCNLIR